MYRFNAGGFEQAIGYLRRALEIDPSFVAAAESLALSVFDQAEMGLGKKSRVRRLPGHTPTQENATKPWTCWSRLLPLTRRN
jgi:Tfp pilus assembly protein PilF